MKLKPGKICFPFQNNHLLFFPSLNLIHTDYNHHNVLWGCIFTPKDLSFVGKKFCFFSALYIYVFGISRWISQLLVWTVCRSFPAKGIALKVCGFILCLTLSILEYIHTLIYTHTLYVPECKVTPNIKQARIFPLRHWQPLKFYLFYLFKYINVRDIDEAVSLVILKLTSENIYEKLL